MDTPRARSPNVSGAASADDGADDDLKKLTGVPFGDAIVVFGSGFSLAVQRARDVSAAAKRRLSNSNRPEIAFEGRLEDRRVADRDRTTFSNPRAHFFEAFCLAFRFRLLPRPLLRVSALDAIRDVTRVT